MRATTGAAFLAAALLFTASALRVEDTTLLERANAWKPGEPVPAELLRYPPPSGTYCDVLILPNAAERRRDTLPRA